MSLYPEGTGESSGDSLRRVLHKVLERLIELYGDTMSSPYEEGVTPSSGDDPRRAATKILAVLNGAATTGNEDLSGLPTSDPGSGKIWNNGGSVWIGPVV